MTPSAGAVWAPTKRPSRTPNAGRSSAPDSRSGHPTHSPCGSLATSTTGTARATTCSSCPAPVSGRLFVEGASTGSLYKFEVLGADGVWRLKADPMARFAEAAPHTASIVYESQYVWGDDDWMWYRGQKKMHAEPMTIYEVHVGSWRQGLTYLELANELVEYVSWQGYTHVEFMPVAQHPFEGSWGYHVTGYYAPMSKFGSPDEFRHLVDKLHQAGIGVIVDWVPGHFATDPWALQRFDGTALVRARGSTAGMAPGLGFLHLQLRP